jgi:hypothetical protein
MNCCGIPIDFQSMCKDFNCQVRETEEGIQINLSPKDPSKAPALKSMVKACKELCDCDC